MPDTPPASVKSHAHELAPSDLQRLRHLDRTVVVLPGHRAADGAGVYAEQAVFLAKELRSYGVDATFLDPPESRTFEVKHGILLDAVQNLSLAVGGGIGTNAGWAGIQTLLRRIRHEPPAEDPPAANPVVELTVTDIGDSDTARRYDFKGTPDGIADLIDQLGLSPAAAPESPPPPDPDDDET